MIKGILYKIVNLNLGTGRAASVLNLVNCFEKVNNIKKAMIQI